MYLVRLALAVAALLAGNPAAADPAGRLSVNTGVTSVAIPRGTQNRRPLRLHTLEIPVQIEAECEPGAMAESVSISIADSRETHRVSQSPEPVIIDTTILLPDRQIAPIVVEEFCMPDDGPGAAPQQLIPDAFTVHVSLHCASQNGRSIHYVAVPIEIRLVCEGDSPSTFESVEPG